MPTPDVQKFTAQENQSVGESSSKPTRSQLLKAALVYARRGIPVFPCKPGAKEPLTKHGHQDATTDPRRIHSWWSRWPRANIGIPTGERSGFLVADVDPASGGRASLDRLEEERGVPPTLSQITGGGGIHLVYRYPADAEIRNSASKIAAGVDVRGEGGYIVAPPSFTEAPYRWAERREITDPPAWMVGMLAESPDKHTKPSTQATRSGLRAAGVGPKGISMEDSGPIPDGVRNETLFRLACSWRGQGHDHTAILEALEKTNRERCAPPIPGEELAKIAASAASYPAGKSGPGLEVLEALDRVEARMWRNPWPRMGGKTDRDVMVSLLQIARRHGERITAGVRVPIGLRSLSLAASVSKRSCVTATQRLREAGWIRRDDHGRRGTEAGAIVLLVPDEPSPDGETNGEKTPRANLHRSVSTTGGQARDTDRSSGASLRAPYSAPRLRWGAPTWSREGDECIRGYIRRLGKSCGQVLDALEAAGGTLELTELAELVGMSRPRDLRRRTVEKLRDAGVVECSGARVVLRSDWLDALARERESAGEIKAQRRDMARYARESEAWRTRKQNPDQDAPTEAQMDVRRLWRAREVEKQAEAQADAQKLPESRYRALLERLNSGERVSTLQGPGKLWRVFSEGPDAVGVLLDSDPERVTFVAPDEITGEAVA